MQTQPQGHDIRRLASMARGAGCRGNYPPPVEGEKCSLTSPFIEQAITQLIHFAPVPVRFGALLVQWRVAVEKLFLTPNWG
jgi:hypothetical protein